MLINYIKTNPSVLITPLEFLFSILLTWKLRDMISIVDKKQAVLYGVVMTFLGGRSIGWFYQLGVLLMPDILHSGIFGLFCFGVLFVYLASRLCRKDFGNMLDYFAIIMSVYGAVNRLNCVIIGCCGGINLWGSLRWPNRILEIVFFLAAFVVLIRCKEKRRFHGQLFLWLMTGYGIFRFLNEFLSRGQVLFCGLKIAHIWAFLCAAIGFSIYSEMILRVENSSQRKKNGGNLKC